MEGVRDPSNLYSDVVVEIVGVNGCSGTLISPMLVLTAAHCIDPLDQAITVFLGDDRSAARTTRTASVKGRMVGFDYEFSSHSPGQDLAVLALDQPVLDEVVIARPRFGGGEGKVFEIAGFSPNNRDYSENPVNMRFRTVATVAGLGYGADDNNYGWHWFLESDSVGLQHGDSGGPLFYLDPDGTRQVVGVASLMSCRSAFGCDSDTEADRYYWAAVIMGAGPGGAWVNATALEGAHSDVWYEKHGTSRDRYWLGEVDYTGPCDAGRDADCDHWFDSHDNCPTTSNPAQTDADDDGWGDACAATAEDIRFRSAQLGGRRVTLHLSHPDHLGWGTIEAGGAGDRVWIDRSYDGGRTWQGFLGDSTIPKGRSDWRTPAVSFTDPAFARLRACIAAAGGSPPTCTGWSAPAFSDFDLDGRGDILWRAIDGQTAVWFMNGTKISEGYPDGKPGNEWRIQGRGDFDGDGQADILWRAADGQIAIWFMHGSELVRPGYPEGKPGSEWQIQGVGDFDGDGRSDILWRADDGQTAIWFMNGSVLARPAGFPAGKPGSEWQVQGVGDFDGDGRADILWRAIDGQIAIWLMNGSVLVKPEYPQGKPGTEWQVQGVGDFDGDGRSDILWRAFDGQIAIWLMNGDQRTDAVYPPGKPGREWRIQDVLDADADGRADIVWRASDGQVAVWLMNGGALKGPTYPEGKPGTEWRIQTGRERPAGTDFDGDGRAEVLWRADSGALAIWFMNGGAVAAGGWPADPGPDWKVVGGGDFDGDGYADVLWRGQQGETAIWYMHGAEVAATTSPGEGGPGLGWTVQGVGDFDADGRADILWRDQGGSLVIWFHGDALAAGAPSYENSGDPAPLDWTVEGVADFDGDGRADIVWRHTGGQVGVWFMNGASFVAAAYPGKPGLEWQISGVGDIDGDSRADIAWRANDGGTAIWYMHGGALAAQAWPGAVGLAWHMVGLRDVDGDGRSEILWRSNDGGTALWWIRGGALFTQAWPTGAGPEWQVQAASGVR